MFSDEEAANPQVHLTPTRLDRLGVDELASYIAEMRKEIARAQAEIELKRHVRSAADSIFKFQ